MRPAILFRELRFPGAVLDAGEGLWGFDVRSLEGGGRDDDSGNGTRRAGSRTGTNGDENGKRQDQERWQRAEQNSRDSRGFIQDNEGANGSAGATNEPTMAGDMARMKQLISLLHTLGVR